MDPILQGAPAPSGGEELFALLVEKARTWLGLKGYVTHVPAPTLDGTGVVAAYHHLFHVEASFRMAKTDLRARPMFHHEKDSIDAHLATVFCALAISRHLQDRTGFSIKRIVRALRPLRDVVVNVQGQHITATTPPAWRSSRIPRDTPPANGTLKWHESGLAKELDRPWPRWFGSSMRTGVVVQGFCGLSSHRRSGAVRAAAEG